MATSTTGPAKRYQTRYGRRNRERVSAVEAQYKTAIKCPYCNKNTVRRLAKGIFQCTKTGDIFTARAYASTKTEIKE